MRSRAFAQILVTFSAVLSTSCGGGSSADCSSDACATGANVKAIAAFDPVALPVVYSWSERTTRTAVVKGHTVTALDNYDPLPDVARVFEGFKEANIVDRAADGTERTLFDCIGNDSLHCAALDPRVSPDNKKIAFAVVYGSAVVEAHSTMATGVIPIKVLSGVRTAQIFVYDTETQTLQGWPRVEGVVDMHPEWISDDKLVFVSDRAKIYPVQMPNKSPSYRKHYALQRWTANVDASNAVNIGPHDDMALHPLVLADGNILTATWRVDEKLSAGVTPENQYWMTMTDQFGGGEFSVLGAHGEQFTQGGAVNAVLALHFYGELSNGDLLTSNYYRGRHMGLGMPIGVPRLPHGVEGIGADFMPAIYSLLPWAQEEDNPTHRDVDGNLLGNGGYPSGLPGGQVLLTKGTGYCYDGLFPENANAEYLKGPGCDTGIYVLKAIPSTHPSDLARVVDHPDRHEFSADVRLPYAATYGRKAPAIQTRTDQGYCSLRVVNTRLGTFHSRGAACTKHGACIQPGFSAADIARLAIYEAKPNTTPQNVLISEPLEGQEVSLLGYAVPEVDGSVNVRIPCDTPYKLRGVSANGTEFVRDQVKHSNRPGEGRLCLGCHEGHTMADHRPDAASLFAKTIAGSKPAAALQR
jgi:hypothetical protein